jgi:hypothetical protein
MYTEQVDDSWVDERMDSIDALWEMTCRLGMPHLLLIITFSFLWQLLVTLHVALYLVCGQKSLEELPVWARNTILWIFLGFGKFKPEAKEQAKA